MPSIFGISRTPQARYEVSSGMAREETQSPEYTIFLHDWPADQRCLEQLAYIFEDKT